MKKALFLLLLTFVSFSAFSKNLALDPLKSKSSELNRTYIDTKNGWAWVVYPDREYTVLLYVNPTLAMNSALKSDPIAMTCNGYSFILAPGNSFACKVKTLSKGGVLSYNIDPEYARNGGDLTTAVIQ